MTVNDGVFTITEKAVTLDIANKSKVYGDVDPALTATATGLVGSDTLDYTLDREDGEDVGTYAITAMLGSNPNYDVTVNDGVFTITEKAVTLDIANKSKVYGDVDPALTATATGLVGSDTLDYTLDREDGEDVGTYAITATLGSNPNYDVTVNDGVFTITEKAVTLDIANKSKVYGDVDPALTATATGLVGSDTLDYTLDREDGEDVGTYAITATLGSNPNYDVTVNDGVFTITEKAVTLDIANKSKVYGDVDPALTATATGLVGSDTLDYTLDREDGEDVGTYAITAMLGSNPNYDVTVNDGVFTITEKAVTLDIANKSKVYGDVDPALTATATGLVGSDTLDYTLDREDGEDVGTYAITAMLGSNPNYDVTVNDGVFTITEKAVTLDIANKSKVYGDVDPALTATATGLVGSDTLDYTLDREDGEDVGTYAITATLGSNPNYDVTVNDGVFTITEKAVTLDIANKSKVYGDVDPALTATATGLVGSDTLDYTLDREDGEDVGTYAITATLGSNPNYDVTVNDGVFTITEKAVTLDIANKSKVYGDVDPALTATATGLVGSDTLDYTLDREDGEDVGTYAITAMLGSNPNYDVTVNDGVFTITEKAVTLDIANKSKVYGDVDPALTATATGLVGSDTLDYTLDREDGEDVGTYAITATLGSNPNYDVTVNDGRVHDHGESRDAGHRQQEQGLRRRRSGADGDGHRSGWQRHAGLHA